MSRLFRRLSLCCIAVALSLTGCATHMIRLQPVRAAFQRGDVAEADRLLADELEQRSGEEDLLLLDRAMVTLADGRPADAERMLRRARDSFDQLEEESSAETTWSMLSDDDARAYHGEDYEKVLVRAMLALSNLVQDGDDAEAYSLQVIDKQQRIVAAAAQPDGTNPKASYQQVALAPYLRGLLREETHRDYDDAARNFQLVVDWQPDFRPGRAHLARAAGGSHSRRGHGVVHVFALVGHGPFKAEVEEMPTSTSLLIADQILSTQLGTTLPPTVAPIKVPRIVAAPGAAGTVQVAVGDWAAGQTETITDVSQMAIRQQEALLPTTLARAVARRTVKKGTIYGVKQGLGMGEGLPSLALDVAGVAWEASENADTRCWSLLPDRIQVLRLELPVGTHTLEMRPLDRQGQQLGPAVPQTVTVADGRNTYLLVQASDAGLVGRPLTNSP
jgi:tetratricopeptide (TPR) repeat protein